MKLGWLQDESPYQGGAELASAELVAAAPDWAEVVPLQGRALDTTVDAFILHNVATFGPEILSALAERPVIKQVHDVWPNGHPDVRRWLLERASLLFFSSPLHVACFPFPVVAPVEVIPNPLNLSPYREAAQRAGERQGSVWLGRMWPGKGLPAAALWAGEQGETLDVYGYGPLQTGSYGSYKGPILPAEAPDVLARYERFVFLPDSLEPFSRVVVEAWAAGCQLVVNHNIGALYWLQEHPEALDRGAQRFWDGVGRTLGVREAVHAQ